MKEGIAISYFHLEDSLNMHETIAYLMQLAEANLFPSFPFQLAPVFFPQLVPPFLPLVLLVSFVPPYPRGAEGNLTLISEHLQFSRTVPRCKLNRANSHFSIDKLFYFTHPFSHLLCFSPVRACSSIFFSLFSLSLYIIKEFRSRQLFPLISRAWFFQVDRPKSSQHQRRLENDRQL